MPKPRPTKPARKPANRYHHGDLPHAMLQEAVRTIQKDGVDALTLRCVGERLGVSRTALYRHFADKQALLAAVAAEGFRTASDLAARSVGDRGARARRLRRHGTCLRAVRRDAPVALPRDVRRSGPPGKRRQDPNDPGPNAFQVLVDAIVEQQRAGLIRDDAPLQLARFIWAVVHGVSMLALDGILSAAEAGIACQVRERADANGTRALSECVQSWEP